MGWAVETRTKKDGETMMTGGGGWWMWVGSVLAIGLVALVVLLVARLLDRPAPPSAAVPGPRPEADEILATRFARGEIDEAEYRRRRDALRR